MKLQFAALLQIQRDLYRIPRGWERFRAYLRTMIDPHTRDLALPIVAMNPMGKEHIPALLDALLAFGAESIAECAVAEAEAALGHVPGDYRIGLVVSDDAYGGWTNRFASEYSHRRRASPRVRVWPWRCTTLWPWRSQDRQELAWRRHDFGPSGDE